MIKNKNTDKKEVRIYSIDNEVGLMDFPEDRNSTEYTRYLGKLAGSITVEKSNITNEELSLWLGITQAAVNEEIKRQNKDDK